MKKIFILILLHFFSFKIHAQSYPIPSATQQPAWVFPFFLEDAHGSRDTVYIGYDSLASQCTCPGDDPMFGEIMFVTDTINFYGAAYVGAGHFPHDSAVRVYILPDLCPNNFCFDLIAANTHFPIKFSWVVSLLRSDSIPFNDQTPLPRAQINMDWYLGVNSLHTASCGSNPIVISDTALSTCYCQYKDSIVIYNVFNDTSKMDMRVSIQITPWSGMNLVGLEETNTLRYDLVYPVPAKNFLFFDSSLINLQFELFNVIGTIVEAGIVHKKISVIEIPSGTYFLRIYKTNAISTKKVIIQH